MVCVCAVQTTNDLITALTFAAWHIHFVVRMWLLIKSKMKIEDNTHWEQTPCIWIEEGNFQINIEKDEVEIVSEFDYGFGGIGIEQITISRKKLLELLSKMDDL